MTLSSTDPTKYSSSQNSLHFNSFLTSGNSKLILRSVLNFIIVGKGQIRQLEGKQRQFVGLFSLAIVLFHIIMLSRYYWGMDPLIFLWIHVGIVGALGFLIFSPLGMERNLSTESIFLSSIMIAITAYFLINEERLMMIHTFNYPPSKLDIWIGWLLIFLICEGLRRSIGLILTLLVVAMGLYAWLVAEIKVVNLNKLIVYSGTTGMWGLPTSISANTIILIFALAGLFEVSGAGNILLRLTSRLLSRTKGAAAKIAVISSGLFGMLSGGAATNVAVTGVFTIPAMLRSGFKPALAGAIESVASTGGAITPPIMGATIFVLVALTETPYTTICIRILPVTAIFYLVLFLQAHLIATRDGIGGVPFTDYFPLRKIIVSGSVLLVPLIVLIGALYKKLSVGLSINISIMVLVIMILLTTLGKGWKQIFEGLIKGGYNAAYLVYVMVIVGLFIEMGLMSGLDTELVSLTNKLSGGALYPSLILGALFSLVLGMAGSILAGYILVVMIVVPAILAGKIETFPAHMFAFYFGVMSYLTPPICQACFVASRFCNESFWKIGWESIKLALPLWILPFVFIYRTELLLMKGGILDVLLVFLIALGGMIMLSVAVTGMTFTRIGIGERLICLISGIFLILPFSIFDFIGSFLICAIVIWEVMKRVRGRGDRMN